MEPSGLFPATALPDSRFAQKLHKKFFQDRKEGFFIECGANTGFGHSICHFFEMELGWTGINIEANPYCYEALVIERPNCLNLNLGLGESRGEAEFHLPHGRKNSLRTKRGNRGRASRLGSIARKDFPGSVQVETVPVNVDTYENIVRDNHIEKVDLFVLDVEGYELEVLKGIGDCKVLPEVFVIETVVVGESAVTEIVKPLGYKAVGNSRDDTFYVRGN